MDLIGEYTHSHFRGAVEPRLDAHRQHSDRHSTVESAHELLWRPFCHELARKVDEVLKDSNALADTKTEPLVGRRQKFTERLRARGRPGTDGVRVFDLKLRSARTELRNLPLMSAQAVAGASEPAQDIIVIGHVRSLPPDGEREPGA
jgi:hypothetical protein